MLPFSWPPVLPALLGLPAFEHVRSTGLRAKEGAGEIHIDNALPLCGGVFEQGLEDRCAGVVDQMIDAAKFCDDLRDAGLHLQFNRHIAGQSEGLRGVPAFGLHGLSEQLGFNIEQRHACALDGELPSDL